MFIVYVVGFLLMFTLTCLACTNDRWRLFIQVLYWSWSSFIIYRLVY